MTPQRSDNLQVKEDISEEELNSEIELIESDDVLRQTVLTCGLQQRKSMLVLYRHQAQRGREGLQGDHPSQGRPACGTSEKEQHHQPELTPHPTLKLAAHVLEVLSNAYIDQHLAVHRPAGQVKFFEQETDRYRENMAQPEAELKKFADEQGGVAPQLARDMTLQKLNDFSAKLESTRAEMASTNSASAIWRSSWDRLPTA